MSDPPALLRNAGDKPRMLSSEAGSGMTRAPIQGGGLTYPVPRVLHPWGQSVNPLRAPSGPA